MKFLDVSLQEREEPKIEQETQSSKYDWRFENSINSGTKFIEIEKDNFKYNKWRTNNYLSNFIDTLFYSNEMNLNYHVTDQMHYDYLFYAIRKTKRFNKKKSESDFKLEKLQEQEREKISLIQEYYKYNIVKSKIVLKILNESQLETIRKRLERGGDKKML